MCATGNDDRTIALATSSRQTALKLRRHQIQSDNRRYCWLLLSPWLLPPCPTEPARAKDATAGNVKMIGATKVPFLRTSRLVVRSESDIVIPSAVAWYAFQVFA